jgi:endonuclease III-like uncharacterized protein
MRTIGQVEKKIQELYKADENDLCKYSKCQRETLEVLLSSIWSTSQDMEYIRHVIHKFYDIIDNLDNDSYSITIKQILSKIQILKWVMDD